MTGAIGIHDPALERMDCRCRCRLTLACRVIPRSSMELAKRLRASSGTPGWCLMQIYFLSSPCTPFARRHPRWQCILEVVCPLRRGAENEAPRQPTKEPAPQRANTLERMNGFLNEAIFQRSPQPFPICTRMIARHRIAALCVF